MTKQKLKILILILTGILSLKILFYFGNNSERNEWFAQSFAFFFVVGFVILYLIFWTAIGFLIRHYKNNATGNLILSATRISAIVFIITLTAAFVKSSYDFEKWDQQKQRDLTIQVELTKLELHRQLDSLDKILISNPDDYLALVERGLIKRMDGQFEASILDYKLALKIKPDDFNANLGMGYSLERLDRKEDAESYYRIAANIDTNSYFAKANRQYIDNQKKNSR